MNKKECSLKRKELIATKECITPGLRFWENPLYPKADVDKYLNYVKWKLLEDMKKNYENPDIGDSYDLGSGYFLAIEDLEIVMKNVFDD